MTSAAPHEAGFSISIEPSGRSFVVQPDETILAAGIRQGVGLPYGCEDGACGSCKCKKLSGEVTLGAHHSGSYEPGQCASRSIEAAHFTLQFRYGK